MPKWDDAADRQMLLSIINTTAASKIEWDRVRASMGDEYTLESLKQRYKRLRNLVKDQAADTPATSATPATPCSQKKTPAKKGTATKVAGKRKAVEEEQDDDEEEPAAAAAAVNTSKKVKKEKSESESDEDGYLA